MEILIGLGIMFIVQITKKWIVPKWGANGVHLFVAVLAGMVVGIKMYASGHPDFMKLLEQIGMYLVAVVGTYHVIFEKIGNNINTDLGR